MKTRRRHMILRLVEDHDVESQEMLQQLLGERGFEVNQATLSRDLRALGVIKQPQPDAGSRYQKARPGPSVAVAIGNLQAFLREIIPSGNLLVLKTRVGGAQPVGLALDQLGVDGIVGTIAGDDTVLVVLAEDAKPQETVGAIWQLMESGRSEA